MASVFRPDTSQARVAYIFYKQSKDVDSFLNSNNASVSRTNYLRILGLACIDILLTLPIGIVSVVLTITSQVNAGSFPFFWGWASWFLADESSNKGCRGAPEMYSSP